MKFTKSALESHKASPAGKLIQNLSICRINKLVQVKRGHSKGHRKVMITPCAYHKSKYMLTHKHRAFSAGVAPGGGGEGVLSTPSITPLPFKLDYSNFIQNYLAIR